MGAARPFPFGARLGGFHTAGNPLLAQIGMAGGGGKARRVLRIRDGLGFSAAAPGFRSPILPPAAIPWGIPRASPAEDPCRYRHDRDGGDGSHLSADARARTLRKRARPAARAVRRAACNPPAPGRPGGAVLMANSEFPQTRTGPPANRGTVYFGHPC